MTPEKERRNQPEQQASTTRVQVQGAVAGYVDVPTSSGGGGGGNSYPTGFSPQPGAWYANSQMPEHEPVTIPSDGKYTYTYLDVPTSGDRPIMISTDFCADVHNHTNAMIEVTGQVGVSNPSEDDYPMRPYIGVMHAVSRLRIPAGAQMGLHIIRLDVIDSSLLETDIPWQMAKGSNGQYPRLAPQVFGPAGVRVSNAAGRVVLIG